MLGYDAKTTPDGMVIAGVPIFVECERGEHKFDADWIKAAVQHAKDRAAEGYLPPLHVRHHGDDGVVAAGFFRITHAAPIMFHGEERMAVFADLVLTNGVVAVDVTQKRLPWRSVEIYDAATPSIDSLALLDHEAPYLELPMLFLKSIDGVPVDARSVEVTPNAPVAASFRRGRAMALMFRFDKGADGGEKDGDDEKSGEKLESDKGDDVGDKAVEGDVATSVKAVIAAIEAGTISVSDYELLIAAIKAKTEAKETEESDQDKNPAPAPGGSTMSKNTEIAALRGEIDGLKAELAAQKAEAETAKAVDGAMQRLSRKPLGANLREQLTAFCKAHGLAAFEAYVAGIEKSVGDAPEHFGRSRGHSGATHSQEVLRYQKDGPASLERAAQLSRTHAALVRAGLARWSEEEFLRINMGLVPSVGDEQDKNGDE
jgi:hypothetical protein